MPRSKPGAVIHDKDEAIARTIRMVTEGKVTAITGEEVSIRRPLHLRPRRQPLRGGVCQEHPRALEAQGVTIAPIARLCESVL